MSKTVTTKQIRALMEAMRELSDACESALREMEEHGQEDAESSNYPSALRGFELVLRFVQGFAGSAIIAKARKIVDPVLKELATVKVDVAKAKAKKSGRSKRN